MYLQLPVSYLCVKLLITSVLDNIPDEDTALQNSAALGKRVLPAHVVNKIEENDGQKMVCVTLEFHALAASPSASKIVCFGMEIDLG